MSDVINAIVARFSDAHRALEHPETLDFNHAVNVAIVTATSAVAPTHAAPPTAGDGSSWTEGVLPPAPIATPVAGARGRICIGLGMSLPLPDGSASILIPADSDVGSPPASTFNAPYESR